MQIIYAPWDGYRISDEKITRGDVVRSVLAALILLTLVTLLASTYIGHSPGPYGACYAPNGRSVPCDVVRQRR
ncbi:MAG: hypothetical protein JWL61_4244 [Gemmatimonadetes bacterium]|jgi:hypothetical protein|nr:hypothetical protein [Gemmatimonadota bacterium]